MCDILSAVAVICVCGDVSETIIIGYIPSSFDSPILWFDFCVLLLITSECGCTLRIAANAVVQFTFGIFLMYASVSKVSALLPLCVIPLQKDILWKVSCEVWGGVPTLREPAFKAVDID